MSDAQVRGVFGGVPSERARLSVLVAELVEVRRAGAVLAAREARILAEAEQIAEAQTARLGSVGAREREMPRRCVAAELAVAVRVNDRAMQAAMNAAAVLTGSFPATLAALEAGRISRRHVDAIVDAGYRLPGEARAAFERVVLDRAVTQTAARVRVFARELAERVDPRPMTERHADAVVSRVVTVREVEDGMAELVALLPAAVAFGIHDRLTRQAKRIRLVARTTTADVNTEGRDPEAGGSDGVVRDVRSLDQVRADVFADMLLTGAPAIDPTGDVEPGGLGAIRAQVQVTVPVTTLAGTTGSGAMVEGRAPIDPDTARRFAGGCGGWDRVMVHPVSGVVLAVDRYRPSEDLKRSLRARDRHCRFPGCRIPARRCDLDHTHDHAHGGATALCNLACFCKRHHTLKHATDWTVRRLGDGTLEWTSPTGRSYRDDPPAPVVFVPDADPPPF
ncbi:DUF222 domain-containing protein [Microbacterium sp. X-17]|uniref:HNH endonuclease signature motif containing protein n=1 Tax=Microbacterium sp. X-17 TaxID=3144404 RepID=UPI0031F58C1D